MGQKQSKNKKLLNSSRSKHSDNAVTVPAVSTHLPAPERNNYQSQPSSSFGQQPPAKREMQSQAKLLYRPLDQARNEIRLLRISPPNSAESNDDELEFASGVVQCQLEYASLDDMEQDLADPVDEALLEMMVGAAIAESPEMADNEFFLEHMRKQALHILANRQAHSSKLDTRVDYSLRSNRRSRLEWLYTTVATPAARDWLPGVELFAPLPELVREWLRTWIWTPLSGSEAHALGPLNHFLALSYVWSSSNAQIGQHESVNTVLDSYRAGGISADRAKELSGLGEVKTIADEKRQIILNGQPFYVGRNLEKALRALREIPEVRSGRRVWIDGLCINQTDTAEKTVEVKRMADIYQKAAAVISWLGDEGLNPTLLDVINACGTDGLMESWFDDLFTGILSNLETKRVYELAQLLDYTYWSRIWIMQEIVLAGPKSVMLYGNRRFSTSNILRFGSRLAHAASKHNINRELSIGVRFDPEFLGISLGKFVQNLEKFHEIYVTREKINAIRNEEVNLSRLWFKLPSTHNATDPRDLVYGITSILPIPLASVLNVDYSDKSTFSLVMTDFAAAHIQYTNSLRWILYPPWRPFVGYESWPSWVPNLTLRFSELHYLWGSDDHDVWRGANEHGSYPLSVTVVPNQGCMTSRAYLLDTVYQRTPSSISKARTALISIADRIEQFPEEIRETLQMKSISAMMEEVPTPPAPATAPLRTTGGHMYVNNDRLRNALLACFKKIGTYPLGGLPGSTIFDIPLPIIQNLPEIQMSDVVTTGPTMNATPKYALLNAALEASEGLDFWGRQLKDFFAPHQLGGPGGRLPVIQDTGLKEAGWFTTCTGYVGVSLYNLQQGDSIFLLNTCPMPVILRKTEMTLQEDGYLPTPVWHMVGSAFIPGVMNGEAVSNLPPAVDVTIA